MATYIAPVVDLEAVIRAVSDRVLADTPENAPSLRLAVDPSFSTPSNHFDGSPGPVHVVGVIGGHKFAAGFQRGLEAGCAMVMSAMQDEIVAMSGRPWPEIGDRSDGRLGVLDVALGPLGIAHWQLRGEPFCAVGHLRASCQAHGWYVV